MKIISYTNNFPLKFKYLFEAIETTYSVRFKKKSLASNKNSDAWLLCDEDTNNISIKSLCDSKCFCYQVVSKSKLVSCGNESAIKFSNNSVLPHFLKNRNIVGEEIATIRALPEKLKITSVLATKNGNPIWAINDKNGYHHQYTSLQLPELNKNEPLFYYFNRKKFISLLPFIVFVKNAINNDHWEPPSIRASFMFDDPNLHWRKYGFIDFKKLLKDSICNNYHVSFATIPIDAYFVHSATKELFKNNPNRLSLLIHGNNHTSFELSRQYSKNEINLLLNQAIHRISMFEKKTGIEVSRVMAPPHGACSGIVLKEMANFGFEAACVSRWSLESYNKHAKWVKNIGMKPSDEIKNLTVFPRFGLSNECHNSILIATLLHQPIIPVGHHEDVENGFDILKDLAEFINGLGHVNWSDMKNIARNNYFKKYQGNTMGIKMLSKRIEVEIPEGVNEFWVQMEEDADLKASKFCWRGIGKDSKWNTIYSNQTIKISFFKKIEICLLPIKEEKVKSLQKQKTPIWPILRRIITEGRDRLYPELKHFMIFTKLVQRRIKFLYGYLLNKIDKPFFKDL